LEKLTMQEFEFLRPKTLSELTGVLAETGGSILAGGTDIIPKMRHSQFSASTLIDVTQIQELRFIRKQGQLVQIGALITHQEIAESILLAKFNPALVTAALTVGCEQTRNRGTLGGNIANASPAADTIPPLLVFDADVHLLGFFGKRVIKLDDFLVSPGKTLMNTGEFITHVSFQPFSDAWGVSFIKLGNRNGMAISIVSGAACVELDPEGKISNACLCLGSVAPRVVRSLKAEAELIGQHPTREILKRASQACLGDISPINDVRSTAAYRKHSAVVIARRALEQAVDQATRRLA
jgi:carbon-monoxide dehydrogenase medium subunit